MKKLLAACICLTISTLTMTGCRPAELLTQLTDRKESAASGTPTDKPRIYMDEVKGRLLDFTGNQLTLLSGEKTYSFDISQATLECVDGMIAGDEISVIYEGQLTDTDTSTVKALKVADEYNKKSQLKEQTIRGKVKALTPNTITIKPKKAEAVTYPITGAEQYFQNGVKANSWVYLHYKGMDPESAQESSAANPSLVKVLSISDIDPLEVPPPTPTPEPAGENPETPPEQRMQAVIQTVSTNILQVAVKGSNALLSLDMSAIPCYFRGGCAPGSTVTVTYTGEFNGTTLEGIQVLAVTGENPANISNSHLSFTVSGEVLASTANTVTIRTYDGAMITANYSGASNSSTGGLLQGAPVCLTFDPEASRSSNIYTCVKITDAA